LVAIAKAPTAIPTQTPTAFFRVFMSATPLDDHVHRGPEDRLSGWDAIRDTVPDLVPKEISSARLMNR
jgi:hypothetical protein